MPEEDCLIIKVNPAGGARPGLPYSTGTVIRGAGAFGEGERVLIETDSTTVGEVHRPPHECMRLEGDLSENLAFLLPPLGFALSAMESVAFEIGETAVVLGSGMTADFFCFALKRGGASPIIRIGDPHLIEILGVKRFAADACSLLDSVSALKEAFYRRPGLALFDAGDNPETLELLLEHLPPWSRVVVAGNGLKRMNLDYYNDIHRKGASLLFLQASAAGAFGLIRDNAGLTRRASRILNNADAASDLRMIFRCI